jgi:hypothetical protein
MVVIWGLRVIFPRCFDKIGPAEIGEHRIAGRRGMNQRQVQTIHQWQALGIDIGSACNSNRISTRRFGHLAPDSQRLIERTGQPHALGQSYAAARVSTILVRPGKGLPMDWKVLRPMITGRPMVKARKRLRSVFNRQIRRLLSPMTPLSATAATSTRGRVMPGKVQGGLRSISTGHLR